MVSFLQPYLAAMTTSLLLVTSASDAVMPAVTLSDGEISTAPPVTDQNSVHDCALHHVVMELGVVPIRYGLPRWYTTKGFGHRREFRRAQKFGHAKEALFPNANPRVLGGCMVGEEKSAEIYFCPICREARKRWLEENQWAVPYE